MRKLIHKSAIGLGFCIALFSSAVSVAQETTEAAETTDFSLSQTNKGYFLIDRETGGLSHCIQIDATLSCSVVLEKEVDLQARLLRLERDLAGVRADLLAQSGAQASVSPTVSAVSEPAAPATETAAVEVTEPAAAPEPTETVAVNTAPAAEAPAPATTPEPVQTAQADATTPIITTPAAVETAEAPAEPTFARDSFLGRLSRYLPNTAKDLAAIAAFSKEAFTRFLDLVTDLKEEHGYA